MPNVFDTVSQGLKRARSAFDSLLSGHGANPNESIELHSESFRSSSPGRRSHTGKPPVKTGDLLAGRFRIGPFLGEGGMGTVYAAEDAVVGSMVAVKLIRPEYVGGDEARSRLIRELRVARMVTHPNICRLYDVGECVSGEEKSPLLFLTMEMLHGETLSERLSRKPRLTVQEAKAIVMQLCAALEALHAEGVVHRDLKPGNVMLIEKAGAMRAVVMDFGLSQPAGVERSAETKTGETAGTPAYMAPEQIRGDTATAASDIFALGIIITQVITGLDVNTAMDRNAGVPGLGIAAKALLQHSGKQWLDVASRCLETDPAKRFPSAKALLLAMEAAPQRFRPEVKYGAVAFGVGVLAVGIFIVARWYAMPISKSIAVLPFTNASGDKALDYAAEGVAESLQRSLLRTPKLIVADWTKSERLRKSAGDPVAIGKKLEVETYLRGNLTKAGPDVQITVELVSTATGNAVWSRKYQRPATELVEVDSNILADLSPKLAGMEEQTGQRHIPPAAAYDLCLRGRHAITRTLNPADFQQGVTLFRESISVDPAYALAHAGLSEAYSKLVNLGSQSPVSLAGQAKAEAQRAIELDPDLFEAQVSFAAAVINSDFDWRVAEAAFHRALRLNPRSATAHSWFAMQLLIPLKRFEEALIEVDRAIALEPDQDFHKNVRGLILYYSRRYQEAIVQLDKVSRTFAPDAVLAEKGMCLLAMRMPAEAFAVVDAPALHRSSDSYNRTYYLRLAMLARVEAERGNRASATKIAADLDAVSLGVNINGCNRAFIQTALGNKDKAFRLLQDCYESRDTNFRFVSVDPAFDSLRQDPRLTALLSSVGLR